MEDEQNVLDSASVEETTQQSLVLSEQARDILSTMDEEFNVVNLKEAAEAFRKLSREFMKAFLFLEKSCEEAAQLCVSLGEVLELALEPEADSNDEKEQENG